MVGIDLSNGVDLPELTRFQEHFHDYKIAVYNGLNCDSIMFEVQVASSERLNLLYDDVTRYYHVIPSLTGALAKQYVFNACNKSCKNDVTHVCDQTCGECLANPPCVSAGFRIPYAECKRHFRSQSCFENHKKRLRANKKRVCERKKCCRRCGDLITDKRHECNKGYCANCNQNKEIGHLCYMRPLMNVLPPSDGVLHVFYDFETTQNSRYSEKTTLHVPNIVCLQQFCMRCEGVADIEIDCEQFGKRKHSFWDDPIGDMMSNLCEPRTWVK
jgi:hypothetical protein